MYMHKFNGKNNLDDDRFISAINDEIYLMEVCGKLICIHN